MGKNNFRSLVGADPITPTLIEGKQAWIIDASDLSDKELKDKLIWMKGKGGELMSDRAREILAREGPLKKWSGTRDAVGSVFVKTKEGGLVEYEWGAVTKSVNSHINPKAKTQLPTLKPKKRSGETARGKRTEKANEYVIAWANNLDERKAWPKGKSLSGYEAWLRKNYQDLQKGQRLRLQKILGRQQDTGHGVVDFDLQEGMSSRSNLAVQDTFGLYGNRTLVQYAFDPETGKSVKVETVKFNTENVRASWDAEAGDIAWRNWDAFEEYLFEGKNTFTDNKGRTRSVLNMDDFTESQRRAVLFDPEFAATVESAQFKVRDVEIPKQLERLRLAKAGKLTGKLGKADAGLRLIAAAGTGDLVGGSLAFGQLSMQHALKNPQVQKRIAAQIAEITAKRTAKTAAKLIPGLDVALSGAETLGYLQQGKLDQAGIAALSGAIGWIPLVGDAAAASLDLTNTGIDIARLDWDGKPDIVETPTADKRKAEAVKAQTEYQNLMYNDYLEDKKLDALQPPPKRINVSNLDVDTPRFRSNWIRSLTGAF